MWVGLALCRSPESWSGIIGAQSGSLPYEPQKERGQAGVLLRLALRSRAFSLCWLLSFYMPVIWGEKWRGMQKLGLPLIESHSKRSGGLDSGLCGSPWPCRWYDPGPYSLIGYMCRAGVTVWSVHSFSLLVWPRSSPQWFIFQSWFLAVSSQCPLVRGFTVSCDGKKSWRWKVKIVCMYDRAWCSDVHDSRLLVKWCTHLGCFILWLKYM